MNQEREQIARLIDPTAWEEYLLEDGRVDAEVAAVFRDAYEESLAKADDILALRSGGEGWQDISTAPKDGTDILVTEGGIAPQFVVRWHRYDGSPNGGYWHPRCGVPVYWHALPASPSTHGEG